MDNRIIIHLVISHVEDLFHRLCVFYQLQSIEQYMYVLATVIVKHNSLLMCNRYPDICPPPPTFAPPGHMPPKHLPPPKFAPPPKNNKQQLRFNNITSIVIKSIYKDVNDEMKYALINSI